MAGCTPASGRRRIILRPVGAARFEGEFDSELSSEDPPGYRSTQRGYPDFKEDTQGHSKRISQFSTRIYPGTQQGYPRTQHSTMMLEYYILKTRKMEYKVTQPLNHDNKILK